ncbi:suppressor protein of bem1/bed5 double mutants-like isoform X2 [Thrips palmi]|nr:suppressor protein of bem1/bed5 double mutants-like isoform X2 [Thrips palmi]
MEQQQALLLLLQQFQQAQQVQQLLSQQPQSPMLLQPSAAFHQLQQQLEAQPLSPLQLLQQRNLLLPPFQPQASITEVPVSSPSVGPSQSSLKTSALAVPSDSTQSSCASTSDAASITTSSKSQVVEVDSISSAKAAQAAKESSPEEKTDSKSLEPAPLTFAVSSDSDEDNEEADTEFQPKKPRKTIDDGKKKSCKAAAPSRSRAGRPKNSKNKTEPKSALVKKLASLQSPSVSIINADNVPETSGRSLRSGSHGRSEPQGGSSSNLHPVDIGFDFTPKKCIDPEILERIEACIVKTSTSWDDVVGLDNVKQRLREAAVLPIIRPELFVGPRAASKGVLLYGPPGTGKTMLAKCAAAASNCTFISIRASDIMSKWIGDGEKGVAALFDVAREKQPTIIFIDEVDSLLSARRQGEHDAIRRIKTEILSQWDGLSGESQSRIMVLGATNRPMDLDLAAMRRFARHLYVPLPDIEARKDMFRKFSKSGDVKVKLTDFDIVALGLHTSNYSAADITNVLNDACMAPLRELSYEEVETIPLDEIRPVCRDDIEKTLTSIQPTCNLDSIAQLEKWNKRSL